MNLYLDQNAPVVYIWVDRHNCAIVQVHGYGRWQPIEPIMRGEKAVFNSCPRSYCCFKNMSTVSKVRTSYRYRNRWQPTDVAMRQSWENSLKRLRCWNCNWQILSENQSKKVNFFPQINRIFVFAGSCGQANTNRMTVVALGRTEWQSMPGSELSKKRKAHRRCWGRGSPLKNKWNLSLTILLQR